MNINLLSLSNTKKSSHICVKYGIEDVYTAGKSANCDLTSNWARFISVAGQRLYTIQRRRPISAKCRPIQHLGATLLNFSDQADTDETTLYSVTFEIPRLNISFLKNIPLRLKIVIEA